jgi:hypothetical protein
MEFISIVGNKDSKCFFELKNSSKLAMEQYPTHHTHSSCHRATQQTPAIGARSKEE